VVGRTFGAQAIRCSHESPIHTHRFCSTRVPGEGRQWTYCQLRICPISRLHQFVSRVKNRPRPCCPSTTLTDFCLHSVNTFFGIYYAQNPTGELRFREPRDIEKNNNYSASQVIQATSPGPECVQGYPEWTNGTITTVISPNPAGSEDCLLLDVWAPTTPTSSKLPVMVQIHGGGYTIGNASTYPGAALVSASQGNLVYVSIQYRLGPFGFLSSAEVKENGVANAGTLPE
jgi:carboxylesterase type B